MYATQWLITFFTHDLKFEIQRQLLDLFLIFGFDVLVKTILTIIKFCEPKLKGKGFEDLIYTLRNNISLLNPTSQDFFKTYDEFDLSNMVEKSFYD